MATKRSSNKFIKIAGTILVVGFILLVLGIVILPLAEYAPHVQRGNAFFYTSYAKGSEAIKMVAFFDYDKAQKDWPLLKYNFPFQEKYKKAKQLFDKFKNEHPAVTAFLREESTQSQKDELIVSLKSKPGVSEVKYVSPEEAYKKYNVVNKNNEEFKKLVSPKILPAQVEVYMTDWNEAPGVAAYLKSQGIVQEVVNTSKVLNSFSNN